MCFKWMQIFVVVKGSVRKSRLGRVFFNFDAMLTCRDKRPENFKYTSKREPMDVLTFVKIFGSRFEVHVTFIS